MGKPLISDAAMRGMYHTMQQVRAAKSNATLSGNLPRADRSRLQAQPESLYAALLSQVHRRDTLLIEGNDALMLAAVDAHYGSDGRRAGVYALQANSEECAGIATGMALQQAVGTRTPTVPRHVIAALVRAFPPMPGMLRLIEERNLAVLLIVQGEPESRADAQRRLLSTKVPVMPVDAADAVAVCRVMQECMLRARNGWGGTVIHALTLPGAPDPLALLEEHLRKRGIRPQLT